jgi:asparagine synthase (glutamine-hydrolysing)
VCGVAGILVRDSRLAPPARESLEAMVASLRHRGPDEAGIYRDRWAGLAHTRLSIIDVAGSHQPLANEHDDLWVSFNGELFNYPELRDELLALGHSFRTAGDTEVLVHGFEAWGDGLFARLNGQFAVALWNARSGTLTLARDRFGVRPLYACEHAGRVLFASELSAIFAADPSVPRALDPVGLAETFTFWTTVAPQTVFTGIEELRPGHVRTYAPGGMREHAFWVPAAPPPQPRRSETHPGAHVAGLRDALAEAVRLRIERADVPVGSYLSGGLDSTLIAALGRTAAGDRFQTFSFRFADAEYDETPFQRRAAAWIGSTHHEILVRRTDIAEAFPDVVAHAERPLLRTAAAPMLLLSRLVRERGIKVVLTGEGADELFAGYDLFREGRVRRFWARRPESVLRPLLLDRLYPYLHRSPVANRALARGFFGRGLDGWREPGFAHGPRWRSTAALQRLFTPDVARAAASVDVVARLLESAPPDLAEWPPLAQDQYLEIRTLMSGYLLASQGDRMLMANGVEGRFPFLDTTVADLAWRLPGELKLRGLDDKHLLRLVAGGVVPPEIVRRPKQPLRAPDALSFTAPDRPAWVDEVVARESVGAAGVFDPVAVERLWRKCLAADAGRPPSNADNMALVGVLSTQLLHRRLVAAAPASAGAVHLDTIVERVGEGAAASRERR